MADYDQDLIADLLEQLADLLREVIIPEEDFWETFDRILGEAVPDDDDDPDGLPIAA